MPDYSNDPVICKAIKQIRSNMEELETLMEEHDSGDLDDYSSILVTAEELTSQASKVADRGDELLDAG